MSENNFSRLIEKNLSRRDFLQFCALGLACLAFPVQSLTKSSVLPGRLTRGQSLGRVILSGYPLHESPDPASPIITEMKQDSLWQITRATVGEGDSANRIWYEFEGKGFAHSRRIQPVMRRFNDGDTEIPDGGCLGEITVPFVDAYTSMEPDRKIAYRFYFATTFWVLKRLVDDAETAWYQLLDDRNYRVYYVPAYYVRLVPESELTPISPGVHPEDKKIVVDLSTQILTAYEIDQVVFMSRISSGVRLREGGFATPKGYYRTTRKRPCRHMANPANAYGSGFDLPGVPWVSYFTSDGVAFHGAYWHNDFGVPHSHGCINMTPQAAKWIYRWTTPTVPPDHYYYAEKTGTRVIVQ